MAIHSELTIHKTAYDLLGLTIDLVRNMAVDYRLTKTFSSRS